MDTVIGRRVRHRLGAVAVGCAVVVGAGCAQDLAEAGSEARVDPALPPVMVQLLRGDAHEYTDVAVQIVEPGFQVFTASRGGMSCRLTFVVDESGRGLAPTVGAGCGFPADISAAGPQWGVTEAPSGSVLVVELPIALRGRAVSMHSLDGGRVEGAVYSARFVALKSGFGRPIPNGIELRCDECGVDPVRVERITTR